MPPSSGRPASVTWIPLSLKEELPVAMSWTFVSRMVWPTSAGLKRMRLAPPPFCAAFTASRSVMVGPSPPGVIAALKPAGSAALLTVISRPCSSTAPISGAAPLVRGWPRWSDTSPPTAAPASTAGL